MLFSCFLASFFSSLIDLFGLFVLGISDGRFFGGISKSEKSTFACWYSFSLLIIDVWNDLHRYTFLGMRVSLCVKEKGCVAISFFFSFFRLLLLDFMLCNDHVFDVLFWIGIDCRTQLWSTICGWNEHRREAGCDATRITPVQLFMLLQRNGWHVIDGRVKLCWLIYRKLRNPSIGLEGYDERSVN